MDDSAVRARWDDAVKRYWVMKSMDDLCCGSKPMAKDGAGSGSGAVKGKGKEREQGWEDEQMDQDGQHGQGKEEGERERERVDEHGRAIVKPHPGAVTLHGLNAEEEHEWRKWTPRLGDVVLVDTPSEGVWPGKVRYATPVKALTFKRAEDPNEGTCWTGHGRPSVSSTQL